MNAPRIVVAPNSFKETFDSLTVAAAMADGVVRAGAEPDVAPLSDGGDGLLDVLDASGLLAATEEKTVTGPTGDAARVRFGWLDDQTAVIESRLVIGLSLVPLERRNPWHTTTCGLGELVNAVADRAKTVVIGLGGSATMDGGVDMARAWGWRPLTADGEPTPPGGEGVAIVQTFERGAPPPCRIIALADVENPLLGDEGAAVYGPQKGATRSTLERLTAGLANLVSVLGTHAAAMAARRGSGAAGGLGFGLRYFGNAELESGAAWMIDRLGLAERIAMASGVVTGEGAFDPTSLTGKIPGHIIRMARAAGVPVSLVAPTVSGAPNGVVTEADGGRWGLDDIRDRTARAVRTMLSLPAD